MLILALNLIVKTMNTFLKISLTFFILIASFGNIYSQKKSKKMLKADLAFEAEQYNKAAELYKKVYKKTKNRALKSEIIFKQAQCWLYD